MKIDRTRSRGGRRTHFANDSLEQVTNECDEYGDEDNEVDLIEWKVIMPGEIIDERARKGVVRPHVRFVVPRYCIPDACDKIEIGGRECKIPFEIFPFVELFRGEWRMSHDLSLIDAGYEQRTTPMTFQTSIEEQASFNGE